MKAEKPFATEADMCAKFLGAVAARAERKRFQAAKEPWTAYSETAGFDILLVRDSDGFQIGIEAKLRMGIEVINQALEDRYYRAEGPDCRAVLVPYSAASSFEKICGYIGLTVVRVHGEAQRGYHFDRGFSPDLPSEQIHHNYDNEYWFELLPTKRHKLPEYVPDSKAGSPSPITLTEWKIGAIKVVILVRKRGYITRQDFKHLGIDHRRWINSDTGWLEIKDGRLVAGPALPKFEKQHPRNYAEIEADFEKWAPTALPLAGASV